MVSMSRGGVYKRIHFIQSQFPRISWYLSKCLKIGPLFLDIDWHLKEEFPPTHFPQ